MPMVPKEDQSVTESESEVEEDCDLWVDEARRQWMRRAAFLGGGICLVSASMGRSGGTSPVGGPG